MHYVAPKWQKTWRKSLQKWLARFFDRLRFRAPAVISLPPSAPLPPDALLQELMAADAWKTDDLKTDDLKTDDLKIDDSKTDDLAGLADLADGDPTTPDLNSSDSSQLDGIPGDRTDVAQPLPLQAFSQSPGSDAEQDQTDVAQPVPLQGSPEPLPQTPIAPDPSPSEATPLNPAAPQGPLQADPLQADPLQADPLQADPLQASKPEPRHPAAIPLDLAPPIASPQNAILATQLANPGLANPGLANPGLAKRLPAHPSKPTPQPLVVGVTRTSPGANPRTQNPRTQNRRTQNPRTQPLSPVPNPDSNQGLRSNNQKSQRLDRPAPSGCDWIIPGKLAIGPFPSRAALATLKEAGFAVILSLTQDQEGQLTQEDNHVRYLRVALPDSRHKVPMDPNTLAEAVDFVHWSITKRLPIYVHCWAGMERSPLVCIAYLCKYHNFDLWDALNWVKHRHPLSRPTSAQLQMLRNFLDNPPSDDEFSYSTD